MHCLLFSAFFRCRSRIQIFKKRWESWEPGKTSRWNLVVALAVAAEVAAVRVVRKGGLGGKTLSPFLNRAKDSPELIPNKKWLNGNKIMQLQECLPRTLRCRRRWTQLLEVAVQNLPRSATACPRLQGPQSKVPAWTLIDPFLFSIHNFRRTYIQATSGGTTKQRRCSDRYWRSSP